MDIKEYQRAKELFLAALELPPTDRRPFLESACAGLETLCAAISAMLEDYELAGSDSPGIVPVPAPLLDSPERIGRYRVISVVGEGGMGVVYRAEQTEPVRREVALKLIKLGMDTQEVLARFDSERQALALMDHPHVARVLDGGTTERGRPYFVMEFVPGIPITDYCDQHRLSTKQRMLLFQDVCHAVQHAHQKGIIHRDLKPSNVLVATQDRKPFVKVIDFGVAKATQQRLTEHTLFTAQGQVIGTPGYMSPEQAGNQADIDTRTDIYSLGVVLYELLVGARPFDDELLRTAGLAEMQRIIREVDPPKPSTRLSSLGVGSDVIARNRATEPQTLIRTLRGDLDWIIMKCLEKDRSRRYASAAELAEDVERYLDSRPIRARPPSTAYQLRKLVARHRFAVGTAAVFLVALLGAIIVVSSLWLRSESYRRRADEHWRSLLAQQEERTAAQRTADQAKAEAEKSAAISDERSRLALGMQNFVIGLGWAASPERGGRTDVTLREALVKGLKETRFSPEDFPELEVRLRQTVGGILNNLGDYEGAEQHLLQALNIRRTLPTTPFQLAECVNGLAAMYFDRGDYEKAEPLFREALQLAPQYVVESNRWILCRAMNDVGVTLSRLGRSAEAVEYLENSVQICREELGPTNFNTLQTTFNLANCLEDLGEVDEAFRWHEDILVLRRIYLGDHAHVARSLQHLGEMRMRQGRAGEAEPLLREAVEIDRRLLGTDHTHYGRTLTKLARTLVAMDRLDEAETMLREAHSICRAKLQADAPDLQEATAAMCDVLVRQGKFDEARQLCPDSN